LQQSRPTPLRLNPRDQKLIDAARDVLRRNYRPRRHTVAAAVRCSSGRIHTGIGVDECAYGPCAEPRAITTAFARGDRDIRAIVAVCKRGNEYPIAAPCGECCQLLATHAPEAMVMLSHDGRTVKTPVRELLPGARTTDTGDVRSVRDSGGQ